MQIISGLFKGLVVKTTAKQKVDKTLRPTTSYSKQVLFNLLNNNTTVKTEIEGKVIMDGFAGTGAVGFEFFSRGATHVTFVEANLENVKQLKENIAKFGISASVISAFLPNNEHIKTKFDIIFIDPPYTEGKGKIAQTIKNLLQDNLYEDGILILETLNRKKDLEEFKTHLAKKAVLENLIYERDSSSKTVFLFFKLNKS